MTGKADTRVKAAIDEWYELAMEVTEIFEGLPTNQVGGCLAVLTAIMAILHSDDAGERKIMLKGQAEVTAALIPILEHGAMVRAASTSKETTQ